ncbi:hypothetical protein PMIN06_006565 [Paraphaeosphaeria minitans]
MSTPIILDHVSDASGFDHRHWILLPDGSTAPGGVLQLGTVLSDPKDVGSIAFRGPEPDPKDVRTTTHRDYKFSRLQHMQDSKVLSNFLDSVLGANIGSGRERQVSISMECESLDTQQFFPSADYVGACLTSGPASEWIQSHGRRRHLYLLTGIKIARGATMMSESSDRPSLGNHGDVATAVGVPITGPSVGFLDSPHGTTAVSGLSSATFSGHFIFAYKLRKLQIVKKDYKNLIKQLNREHPRRQTSAGSTFVVSETEGLARSKVKVSMRSQEETGGTSERKLIVTREGEGENTLEVEEEDVDAEEIDRPLRILTLDGGGVRGISSLLILKDIMDGVQTEEKSRRKNSRNPGTVNGHTEHVEEVQVPDRPCEYFDLICGTSTGGLIAIMLGRLAFTVDECIVEYRTMAKRIFSSKGKTSDVLYDAQILEKCVEEAIAKSKLSKDAKLDNTDASVGCRTFVVATATMMNGAEPLLLRSYRAKSEIPSPFDCTILQACRATSAAPSFFEPMLINGMAFGEHTTLESSRSQTPGNGSVPNGTSNLSLSDGGLTANNPTFEALFEIDKIPGWGRRKPAAVVSIGTGRGTPPKLTRSRGFGYKVLGMVSKWQALRLDVAKYCADLVTDTEATHARVVNGLQTLKIGDVYFRLNAAEVGEFDMDKWEKLPEMESLTTEYVQKSAEHKKAKEQLAKILPDPEYARDRMLNERYGFSWVVPTTEASFKKSLRLPQFTRSMGGVRGMTGGLVSPNSPSGEMEPQDDGNRPAQNSGFVELLNGDSPRIKVSDKTAKLLDAAAAATTKIPWTWPLRNNQVPSIHSMIFYNYDEKTKSTWDHKGHKQKDQSVLLDRRDEGESAVAVLEMTSEVSFVSSSFVQRWKIKTYDIPEMLRNAKVLINGFEVHCDRLAYLSFRCAGFDLVTQRTWFRVLDTDDVEVVFGSNIFERGGFGRASPASPVM